MRTVTSRGAKRSPDGAQGRLLLLCCLFAGSAAVSQKAYAQDRDAPDTTTKSDDIVVIGRSFKSESDATATKLNVPISETPSSIAILDQSLLNDLGVTDYREAVEFVPGVTNFGRNVGAETVFIARGFSLNPENALKINGASTGTGVLVDDVAIDRVEFVKGANAVTYGEVSAGGFINLALRAAPKELGGEARLEGDSFGAAKGSAVLGSPLNSSGSIRGLVGLSIDRSKEFYDTGDRRSEAYYGTLSLDITDRLTTSLYGYHDRRNLSENDGLPAGEDLTDPNNPRILVARYGKSFYSGSPYDRTRSKLTLIQANTQYKVSDDLMGTVILSQSRNTKNRQGVFPLAFDFGEFVDLTPGSPDFGTLEGFDVYSYKERVRNRFAEVRLTGKTGLSDAFKLSFYLSGEYRERRFDRDDFGGFGAAPPLNLAQSARRFPDPFATGALVAVSESNSKTYSVSAVTTLDAFDRLKLNFGIRKDFRRLDTLDFGGVRNRFRNNVPNYSFSAVLKLTDTVNAYYAYGESTEYLANQRCDGSTLSPETGRSHEGGVKWSVNPRLLATATYFDSRSTNSPETVICAATDPNPTADENSDAKQFGKGFELELIGSITPAWNVIAGYANIRDGRSGGIRFVTPRHSLSMFTVYDLLDGPLRGLGAGVGVKYEAGRPVANEPSLAFDLGDFVRVDASLFYKINDRINLQLKLNNVFDEEYYSSYGDPYFLNVRQPGRSLFGSLSYTF